MGKCLKNHKSFIFKYKKDLISKARKARTNAYAPYSKFQVGAVLVAENGEEFHGVNVENLAYPSGTCAEVVCVAVNK